MNILIVDDQTSVLDGLLHGIHFDLLKINHVYTATNVSDAKADHVFSQNTHSYV